MISRMRLVDNCLKLAPVLLIFQNCSSPQEDLNRWVSSIHPSDSIWIEISNDKLGNSIEDSEFEWYKFSLSARKEAFAEAEQDYKKYVEYLKSAKNKYQEPYDVKYYYFEGSIEDTVWYTNILNYDCEVITSDIEWYNYESHTSFKQDWTEDTIHFNYYSYGYGNEMHFEYPSHPCLKDCVDVVKCYWWNYDHYSTTDSSEFDWLLGRKIPIRIKGDYLFDTIWSSGKLESQIFTLEGGNESVVKYISGGRIDVPNKWRIKPFYLEMNYFEKIRLKYSELPDTSLPYFDDDWYRSEYNKMYNERREWERERERTKENQRESEETSIKVYRQGYADGQTGFGLPAHERVSARTFYMAKGYNFSIADYYVYEMGYNDGVYGRRKQY